MATPSHSRLKHFMPPIIPDHRAASCRSALFRRSQAGFEADAEVAPHHIHARNHWIKKAGGSRLVLHHWRQRVEHILHREISGIVVVAYVEAVLQIEIDKIHRPY